MRALVLSLLCLSCQGLPDGSDISTDVVCATKVTEYPTDGIALLLVYPDAEPGGFGECELEQVQAICLEPTGPTVRVTAQTGREPRLSWFDSRCSKVLSLGQ